MGVWNGNVKGVCGQERNVSLPHKAIYFNFIVQEVIIAFV